MRPLTRKVCRGTLGTAGVLAALGACSSDPARSRAAAPTPDAAPARIDAGAIDAVVPIDPTVTALVVGIEVAASVVADDWTIDVTTDDGVVLAHDVAPSAFRQLRVLPPADRPDAKVRIELTGASHVEGYPDQIVGPRVATAAFVPGHAKLAYLYLDSTCAYDAATVGCTADQACIDGACGGQALGDLPDYAPTWRDNPPSPCSPDAPAELDFGEGNGAFVTKNDGDVMTVNCGSQGGHHLWIGLQMRGLPQSDVDVDVTADRGDAGAPPPPLVVVSRFKASPTPGTCQLVFVQFQLDGQTPIAGFLGQPLDITVAASKLTDPLARKATVRRRVQIAQKMDPQSCGPQ